MFIQENCLNQYYRENEIMNNNYIDYDPFNNIKTIPIVQFQENNLVYFDDLDKYCEDNDIYLEDCIDSVIYNNKIDNINVVVDESTIILYPELVDIVPNIILKPVNENDIVSLFVDNCIDYFLETGEDIYLDIPYILDSINEASGKWEGSGYDKKEFGLDKSYEDKKKFWDRDASLKGKKMDVTSYIQDSDGNYHAIKRKLTDAPKNVLAKAAARLREVYRKWLKKANEENSSGKQGFFKKIARKIMQAIDWIMRKIENMHVNNYERSKKTVERLNNIAGASARLWKNKGRGIGSSLTIHNGKKDIDSTYVNNGDLSQMDKAYDQDNKGNVKYIK